MEISACVDPSVSLSRTVGSFDVIKFAAARCLGLGTTSAFCESAGMTEET